MLALEKIGRHPFAVKAHFKQSLVLSYALPLDLLRAHIPSCLELDSYQERYGFLAVAAVQTQSLRPSFFPAFMGSDFTLLGYRIFVRYRGNDGRKRRGLYIIRSETNRARMVLLGNLFTRYHYRHTRISWEDHLIKSNTGLHIKQDENTSCPELPETSVFPDWHSARRFAGPMPFTFSYCRKKHLMTSVEGVRTQWKPQAIKITSAHIPILNELGLPEARLSNAFMIKNVPYYWKKGSTEPCQKTDI